MRIVVVDDHEIVRQGLRMILPSDPVITVVAEAKSSEEALTAVRRTAPDVVLVDYRLPGMTGDELCRRILQMAPATKVVVLTTYLSEDVVQRTMDAGAVGFVTKAAGLDELRRVLAEIGRTGEAKVEGGTAATVQYLYETATVRADPPRLSPQQERVLELAAEGLTYAQISARLHVSESTVRFHIQRLKDKLGVHTKAELIALAIRSALIAPGRDASAV